MNKGAGLRKARGLVACPGMCPDGLFECVAGRFEPRALLEAGGRPRFLPRSIQSPTHCRKGQGLAPPLTPRALSGDKLTAPEAPQSVRESSRRSQVSSDPPSLRVDWVCAAAPSRRAVETRLPGPPSQRGPVDALEDAAEPEPKPEDVLGAIRRGDEAAALSLLQRPRLPGLNEVHDTGGSVLHGAISLRLHGVALAILARADFQAANGTRRLHSAPFGRSPWLPASVPSHRRPSRLHRAAGS